jgi:hypothetical protein
MVWRLFEETCESVGRLSVGIVGIVGIVGMCDVCELV